MEETLDELISSMQYDLNKVREFLNGNDLTSSQSAWYYLADMKEVLEKAIHQAAEIHIQKVNESHKK